MNYKVIIKPCTDQNKAQIIAQEIARWSGSTVDVVLNAVTQKQICIQKEASEPEAKRLKQQFEAAGAVVELVPLSIMAQKAATSDDDDEEDDVPGRLLSDAEYARVLDKRPDIFIINNDKSLRNIEVICLIFGMLFGFSLSFLKVSPETNADFINKTIEEKGVTLSQAEVDRALDADKEKEKEKEQQQIEEQKKQESRNDKKTQKESKMKGGGGGHGGGGGDPRARVTQKGVLGIISGKIKGKAVGGGDVFGKGGFATNIDAVLSGVGGLKSGGSGGVGRKGVAGIGFGSGYGSGFGGGGGGSGGIDDLLGGLMGGVGDGSGSTLTLKKRGGNLEISAPPILKGDALIGGRSRASIERVVMQNLGALQYEYNKRLREKPGLTGKIKVRFTINEFGAVVSCEVVESTMDDKGLEDQVIAKIRRWRFEKIDKPGDITEVVYPFKFTQ